MDCDEYIQRRVKLGYVADCGTCVQLVDSIGNQVFDMLPIIQAGETDTSLQLLTDLPARIRYYPEKYTRTEGKDGCFYDVCIKDIAALINLDDLGDVDMPSPSAGDTIIYNPTTGMYEAYNIPEAIANLQLQIDALKARCAAIEGDIVNINATLADHNTRINQQNQRISNIEYAIYNWADDKTTKIPRGNINVTSGGYMSNNGIFTRPKGQDEDLDFE